MLTETELKLIKKTGIIPNHLLAAYLADKITVKPNYPAGLEDVGSMYQQLKDNMKANAEKAKQLPKTRGDRR